RCRALRLHAFRRTPSRSRSGRPSVSSHSWRHSKSPTTWRRCRPTSISTPRRWRRSTDDVRVLGVDPGTAVTGYGIVERNGNGGPGGGFGHLIECGVIRLPRSGKLEVRLAALYAGIIELVARHPSAHS